jgi:isopenicillin-N N-acyltransferase like protein
LVILHIIGNQRQTPPRPSLSQVTEAGIIGKIGVNEFGVATCLNAILARGVNYSSLPVHLALRKVLESTSRTQAIADLASLTVASAAHVLIADDTGATSMEYRAAGCVKLEMQDGQLTHANHFIGQHPPEAREAHIAPDSLTRMDRIKGLLEKAAKPRATKSEDDAMKKIAAILQDEDGFPQAINRYTSPGDPGSTLFSIIINLKSRTAFVTFGRPTDPEGKFVLRPRATRIRGFTRSVL